MKKKVLSLLIIFLIISIGAIIVLPSYLSKAVNAQSVEIDVPQGASLNRVSQLLYDQGVIKSKLWFRYKAKEAKIDRKIKPGIYTIPSNASLEDIFALLEKGVLEEPVILTVPEGFSLYQIAERVESLGFGSKEEFIEATKKYFKEAGYDFDTSQLYFEMEGYLYPDTYHFTEMQTVDDIVKRLIQKMDEVFTQEYRQRAQNLNLSIHEVLTIASLIEREAYHDGERATVSGVIHNRLKKGMILQVDATVIYGVGEGTKHKNQVLNGDLEKTNPFNTYKVSGLPPGPIASPGKASIKAALYPEDHDYLYYVMGENGHVFSKTYDEHLVNVSKYRELNRSSKKNN